MFELGRQQKSRSTTHIPPFSYGFSTPFYDLMMRWGARESTFKPRLVEQARIERNHRVLDLGCGTATLTILIKKTHPDTEVVGIDADTRVLELAKSKVASAGMDIALDCGTVLDLPYPDESFNRVMSSMVFHHLSRDNKVRSLKEAFRVLKPGGELHVADLAKPQNALMYLPSLIIGRLEETSDNLKGFLPEMFRTAGFDRVEETSKYQTICGTIALYRAQKPVTAKNQNRKTMYAREEEYYALLKKYARVLAPFYDTVTLVISSVRDKVVDLVSASSGSKILDVCTGTGKQAFAFAKRGYDVVGIDLSEDMLKVAKKKNKYANAKFEIADATNLPFENGSFEVSCVSFALHDMIPTVREKALNEMVRVTKPKGTILVVDYALPENNVSRFLIYNFVKLYEPYYSDFIKSDLGALLRKSRIEVKETHPVLLGAGRIIKGMKTDDSRLKGGEAQMEEVWRN